jgi:hypothetical protein
MQTVPNFIYRVLYRSNKFQTLFESFFLYLLWDSLGLLLKELDVPRMAHKLPIQFTPVPKSMVWETFSFVLAFDCGHPVYTFYRVSE